MGSTCVALLEAFLPRRRTTYGFLLVISYVFFRSLLPIGCSYRVYCKDRAAIAQLGERQTEDLKVPGSIPGLGTFYTLSAVVMVDIFDNLVQAVTCGSENDTCGI